MFPFALSNLPSSLVVLRKGSFKKVLTQGLSAASKEKRPLTKYYKTVPLQLFRIGGTSKKVQLRNFEVQKAKGSASYDYVPNPEGKIHPAGDYFTAPNGMSLRPEGINMTDILAQYRGKVGLGEYFHPFSLHSPLPFMQPNCILRNRRWLQSFPRGQKSPTS
jgi:hypothetical protein